MFEIEMKAHVPDRKTTVEKLNSFAHYICSLKKNDTYYHVSPENDENYKSFRIRDELIIQDGKETRQYIYTYKKKETKQSADGTTIEVNSENEFTLSDPEPLIMFINDIGGKMALTKQKITECWHYTENGMEANIELCTVPPLGDFLEIEIISDRNDDQFVSSAKKMIENLFLKSGLTLDLIEDRYYSQMLKETSAK